MSSEMLFWVVSSLLLVPISWVVPRQYSGLVVGLATLACFSLISPIGAAWLLLSTAATYWVSKQTEHKYKRSLLALVAIFVVAVFLVVRELHWLSMAGVAYFTLRNLSVILDSWMQRAKPSSWGDMFTYQFFMPVMAVGPIHQHEAFSRSWRMRRLDSSQLANGAERALTGLFFAVVLGTWLADKAELVISNACGSHEGFLQAWSMSAFAWVQLYLIFSGFSAFAIGVALMMGLRLDENFNQPFLARTLMDFWTRWHISLSNWCRDYVYQPVAAVSRSRLLGLTAAMAAIGLWHESSFYYMLWALWQVLGIVINRYWIQMIINRVPNLPGAISWVIGPLWVFTWLSLTKPVIGLFLE